ncbi:MAG TPA: hypothetical protein VIL30_08775 [Ramlibacter sp.]|jgi:hypothetical protein
MIDGSSRWRAAGAEAQVWLWRFGWAWPAAAVVALLAVALHFAVFVPARSALVAAGTERLQAAMTVAPAPREQATSEHDQVQALQRALRSNAEPTELIRRLNALARAEQITLVQAEYQQQFHADTQLLELQLTQPMKASYPQLKRYIESVLRSVPNASLDHVAARRDNVGQAQLDARLRWSLWLHAGRAASREGEKP